jgi:hypothetical protein
MQAQPTTSPLLDQLKDIHPVPEPGFWPPAPGWWLLAAVALVLLGFLVRYAWQRFQVSRRRRRFIRVLEGLRQQFDPVTAPHDYLAGMNRFFRAVALRAFPGTECNRLQGEEWVAFIRSLLPLDSDQGKDADSLQALAAGPYQPCPAFDPDGLVHCATLWVKRYG